MPVDPGSVTSPIIKPVADTVGGAVGDTAPVVEDTVGDTVAKVIGDIAGVVEDL